MMMGVWLATSFTGNFIAGYARSFWSQMDKAHFLLMIARIAGLAGGGDRRVQPPLRAILPGMTKPPRPWRASRPALWSPQSRDSRPFLEANHPPKEFRWTSREKLMRKDTISCWRPPRSSAWCRPALLRQSALTGTDASSEEGPMEGVLFDARQDGFPPSRSPSPPTPRAVTASRPPSSTPATTRCASRAVGYDLDGKPGADIAAGSAATADLKLKRTRNISAQLTNAEWLESVPGTPVQKDALFNCVSCHTVERIVKSTHDAAEFVQTMARMGTYANQSVPTRPQKGWRSGSWRSAARSVRRCSRNAPSGSPASISARVRPGNIRSRPCRARRPRHPGIITEYDLPRPLIEPHDVGSIRTATPGTRISAEQNIASSTQTASHRISLPDSERLAAGQPRPARRQGATSVRHDVQGDDRPLQSQDREAHHLIRCRRDEQGHGAGQHGARRVGRGRRQGVVAEQRSCAGPPARSATGNIETDRAVQGVQGGGTHNIYDIGSGLAEQVYFTDFAQQHVGRVDAQDPEVTLFEIPTKKSAPRRGMMGCAGPHVVRRIPRQQSPCSTPRPRSHRVADADAVGGALRRGDRQRWRGLTSSMMNDPRQRARSQEQHLVDYLAPARDHIRASFVDNTTRRSPSGSAASTGLDHQARAAGLRRQRGARPFGRALRQFDRQAHGGSRSPSGCRDRPMRRARSRRARD